MDEGEEGNVGSSESNLYLRSSFGWVWTRGLGSTLLYKDCERIVGHETTL